MTPGGGPGRGTASFLAVLLGAAGALHLARPRTFDAIVPRALPGPARAYTLTSGVAELGVAGLLAAPRTRALGGLAAAGLFVAVFPANVQMAYDWRNAPPRRRAIALGRLPLQGVLIAQALHVAHGARDRTSSTPSREETLARIAARAAPQLPDPVAELDRARAERPGR
ncbi:hypothetical protein [Brachybacterium saurashtrense]|uniref:DoxX family protein n=1 Tax=Brachybacterium saurashtrense TaxID=556288 RepID=UPI0026843870